MGVFAGVLSLPLKSGLGDGLLKMVTIPATLAEAIEDYHFANRLKTEAEAIRQLLDLGLNLAGASTPPSQ